MFHILFFLLQWNFSIFMKSISLSFHFLQMNFTDGSIPRTLKVHVRKKNSFDDGRGGFLSFQYAKQNILLRNGIPSGFLATPSESPKINKYFFLLFLFFLFFCSVFVTIFETGNKTARRQLCRDGIGEGWALSLKCGRPYPEGLTVEK